MALLLSDANPRSGIPLTSRDGVLTVAAGPIVHYKDEGGNGSGILVGVPPHDNQWTLRIDHSFMRWHATSGGEREERSSVCDVTLERVPQAVAIKDGSDTIVLCAAKKRRSALVHFTSISRSKNFVVVVADGQTDILRASVKVRSKRKKRARATADPDGRKAPKKPRKQPQVHRRLEARVAVLEEQGNARLAARVAVLEQQVNRRLAARVVALEEQVKCLLEKTSRERGASLASVSGGAAWFGELPSAAPFEADPCSLFAAACAADWPSSRDPRN